MIPKYHCPKCGYYFLSPAVVRDPVTHKVSGYECPRCGNRKLEELKKQ